MTGVVQVLDDQRPIQPVLVAQLGRALGRQRLVAGEDLHRITWDQVQHQKAQHRDADEHRDRLQQALVMYVSTAS